MICCYDRICRFGEIVVGAGLAPAQGQPQGLPQQPQPQMILNQYGQIAHSEWVKLAERFPNFEFDVFQIMPNHMHGIIVVGAGLASVHQPPAVDDVPGQGQALPLRAPMTTTIGDIVGAYKSLVANACLNICKSSTMGKIWQRNYYEHIIRNESSYQNIAEYIMNNPAKWWEDRFYA